MAKRRKMTATQWLLQVPFILYSLSIAVVCLTLLVTPFRSGEDVARGVFTLPQTFTFRNFIDAWVTGLGIGTRDSLFLAGSTAILTVILGALAGYAFSFIRFRVKGALYVFMYAGIYISTMLIAIPLFLQYRDLHLINNLGGALIIFLGLRLPFSIYLFKSFFDEFSKELIEAAKMDGLGDLLILSKITLPLSKGVVTTVVLFNFTAVWTDYLIGLLFLQQANLMTIMPKILSIFGQGPLATHATPLGQGYAGLLVSTIPVVLIYFFSKKHYITGLTFGSIK